MSMRNCLIVGTVLTALGLACACAWADARPPQPDWRVMSQATYLRVPEAQSWHLRFAGDVTQRAGAYAVLHDAEGSVVLHRHIPHGHHPADSPYEIPVPADAGSGDFRLLIFGHQNVRTQLFKPISDLPYEVYGRTRFVIAHGDPAPLYFKPRRDTQRMSFQISSRHAVVWDGDELLIDSREDGERDGRRITIEFDVEPDRAYRLETLTRYLTSESHAMFTFDPAMWFDPDEQLDGVRWWQNIEPAGDGQNE